MHFDKLCSKELNLMIVLHLLMPLCAEKYHDKNSTKNGHW